MEEEDGIIEEKFAMLGCDMGLEVDTEDVDALITKHTGELTTDELGDLK